MAEVGSSGSSGAPELMESVRFAKQNKTNLLNLSNAPNLIKLYIVITSKKGSPRDFMSKSTFEAGNFYVS